MSNYLKRLWRRIRPPKVPEVEVIEQTKNSVHECRLLYNFVHEHLSGQPIPPLVLYQAPFPRLWQLLDRLRHINQKLNKNIELASSDLVFDTGPVSAEEFYLNKDNRYTNQTKGLTELCKTVHELLDRLERIEEIEYGVEEYNYRLTRGLVTYLLELGRSMTQ